LILSHRDAGTEGREATGSGWVAVLEVEDVEPGKVAVVEVDGKRLAVCRTAEPCGDGEWFVIADVCTHDGGALDQGELIGCEIECPRHGARFDVTTGKVKRLPAVRPVKSYPSRVVDGRVEVEVT
jgi:3-phenylpropionate/trans-cinnamate dioxygenase ferredoxin subunit